MKTVILKGTWTVHAPFKRVYAIITDFEHAHTYFPLVASSLKIRKKNGNHLLIDAVSKTFGIPFRVAMDTQILPDIGFTSVNTSSLAIEHESFLMEQVPDGTKIIYRNEVEIKNTFLKIFAKLLIGNHALLFWKYAYIDRLETLANADT